jgi:hypothetical protein
MVWPEDVPPEVVTQQRSAAKKDPRTRKLGLRSVSDSADRNTDAADTEALSSADRAGKDVRHPSSRPPRLVQVVSKPEVAPAASASKAAEAADAKDAKKPDSSTRTQEDAARPSATPSATKRSRPPYLRLVD